MSSQEPHHRLIVATDLDGTLLDHHSYRFDAAAPALQRLKAMGVPLVLASSKTASEIAHLHAQLQLGTAPAIVENGAGIHHPGDSGGSMSSEDDYHRIRVALAKLPRELRESFRGFGDMDAAEVAALTGLDAESSIRAKQRHHSEPGLWMGEGRHLAEFEHALQQSGIKARRGGRFLTLSFGRTKADALQEIRTLLRADTVIALGDAPNDIEMLECADHAVIVRNDSGRTLPALDGESSGRIVRTEREGPSGWNDAVLSLLDALALH